MSEQKDGLSKDFEKYIQDTNQQNNQISDVVAVDIMGADTPPEILIQGVIDANLEFNIPIVIVGDEKIIQPYLQGKEYKNISIENSEQIISMSDRPSTSVKHKLKSSLITACQLVAMGKCGGLFSSGNTGAILTASIMHIGKISGIIRPALAIALPTAKGNSLLIDIGANVECKSEWLFQFAIMGFAYTKELWGLENPKIALLNIGEEDYKGTKTIADTYRKLKKSGFNFYGNVEGNDILQGVADIYLCDGFIGNILLKLLESLPKPDHSQKIMKAMADSQSVHGGAPLLGLIRPVVIGHGKTTATATKYGIKQTAEYTKAQLNRTIPQLVKYFNRPFWKEY